MVLYGINNNMEIKMTKQIKFGVHFRGHWDTYTVIELEKFMECSEGIEPIELKDRYVDFLDKLSCKKNKAIYFSGCRCFKNIP